MRFTIAASSTCTSRCWTSRRRRSMVSPRRKFAPGVSNKLARRKERHAMLRSTHDARGTFRAWALGTGFAVLLVATPARAQNATAPVSAVPWSQIDAGLAQLAGGDGKTAEALFEKARSGDDSGLAALLMELTEAYLAYHRPSAPGIVAPVVRTWQWLDTANRHYHQR